MYHTEKRNQALFDKNLTITRFASKDLQIADYQADIERYIAGGTLSEQKIAHLFLRFRYLPFTKLTNEYVAKLINCSTKTVTRATNKFHRDGFITKHQENPYAPNYYTFNEKIKKGKRSFTSWLNSLSSQNQDLYSSHCIRIGDKNNVIFTYGNVPQNKSINLILDNLFINLSPSSRLRARDSRIFKKIKDDHKKGSSMNFFQKQLTTIIKPKRKLINDTGHSPMVRKPEISIEEEIKAIKLSIAGFEKQLEDPTAYWDPREFLFSVKISATKNFLCIAQQTLKELEIRRDFTSASC
jgi:hypothetical protein